MSRPTSGGPSGEGPGGAARRRRLLLGFWLLCGLGLGGRAVELQVLEGAHWRERAEQQHRTTDEIPAARGSVLDRNGVPLALSHEAFRVSVAPHEVQDTTRTLEALGEALELSPAEGARIFEGTRRWVVLPGRFSPAARDAVGGLRGVYVDRELRRFRPHGDLVQGVLGVVIDEEGTGGIEQEFDEHLRGTPGVEVLARDSEGRAIPGETWIVEAPRSGGRIVLTLDADMQEIAHEALREAMETTEARGGDLLVTDPRSGEVLAMVSVREDGKVGLGGINAPYEPGSTLKPFTVAALLSTRKASLADSVDTGTGQWTTAGRTLTDVSALGKVDLASALRSSSNVGVAKMAERLTPAEQYETLRDFGFGIATGIPLPGESGGRLRRPREWSRQSPASLAIGYEIGVTPLQMAMAYGALANGGILMEPRLVREVRDPAGRPVERREPGSVRRVVPAGVAAELREVLVGAVDEGTGTRARLETFSVAGKSGTSRAQAASGGYEAGAYLASFIGFFPAEDPQLLVFVKLDRPQGEYYGGATAAPVTRATMEAVLAAHRSPLDRGALATIARARDPGRMSGAAAPSAAPGGRPSGSDLQGGGGASFASLPVERDANRPPAPPMVLGGSFALPDLAGLPLRSAVRRLHGMGVAAAWEAPGSVGGTRPAAGAEVSPGDTIRLLPAPPGRPPPAGGSR